MKMRKKGFVLVLLLSLLVVVNGIGLAAGGQDATWGDFDLGGRTITFVTYPEYNNEEKIELVEEMFNCKIQIHKVDSWENPEQHMARLLSGDSEWDIWQLSHPAYFDLVG